VRKPNRGTLVACCASAPSGAARRARATASVASRANRIGSPYRLRSLGEVAHDPTASRSRGLDGFGSDARPGVPPCRLAGTRDRCPSWSYGSVGALAATVLGLLDVDTPRTARGRPSQQCPGPSVVPDLATPARQHTRAYRGS